MWLPFELWLALRYLRPKRTYVSIITLISIVGVMLGVAVLIIVMSVMSGFDRDLRDKIMGFYAHLKVSDPNGAIKDYSVLRALIATNVAVKGAAPFVMGQIMVKSQPAEGSSRVLAPVVRGVDPRLEGTISALPSSIVSGQFDVRGNGVLVGRQFARKMGLAMGDVLNIYSLRNLERMEQSRKDGQDEAILPDEYEVRGIFDVGYYEYNELFIICSLANAQDLYGLEDSVHGLFVMLHDPGQSFKVRTQLEQVLRPGLEIRTWQEDNSVFFDALTVEKNVMYYLLFFIMIVAAFGITSVLITFVVQKTREIGLLKALGATNRQVRWLFLSQSLAVGVFGVTLGVGLGLTAVAYRNEFLYVMRRVTGFELFPAQIYNFSELPALIIPQDIIIICGGSLLICVLAGLLPAWNASRLRPVEALRHE